MTLSKNLRLTVAAFIASVTLSDVAQLPAQFAIERNGPQDSISPSSVLVKVRPQSPQGVVGSPQVVIGEQQPIQPGALQPDFSTVPTDGGRLAPIAMESVRAPITAANISVDEIGTKVIPLDEAAKQVPSLLPLPGGQERGIGCLTYRWQSANICHWPLYFEDAMLERHGQQICPTCLQPAVSGAKFFSNILLYPYKATLQPACESRYTLGHFRPGSCAPLLHDTLPWSPRAAAVQGAAITGVAVGLPW